MIMFLSKAILGQLAGQSLETTVNNNVALIDDITPEAKAQIIRLTEHTYGARTDEEFEALKASEAPPNPVMVDVDLRDEHH